ncbi:TFIIB-type zinc finger domain-containing protein [Tropicimonas marinistellae]|uniref:TFIIB-type zinc finger domain-containing protein n=1 Tax=Tropicimonas marinistellae TaxID=1739787 RepID=UPI000B169DFD|nr:TFIIB-type zinc finger domain-containing protein [Tropicimonas marinistellae]
MSRIPKISRSEESADPPPPVDTIFEDLPPEAVEVAEKHRFPCPACGADLRFSADRGDLVCDHCGHVEHVSAGGRAEWDEALQELDYERALRLDIPASEIVTARTAHCDSCGANFEMSGSEQAKECPFCASPVVTDTGPQRHLKPTAVLPFALDEETARKAMSRWLGRLWFAPNGLKQYARKGRKMKGIYVPFWTYDSRTRTEYAGRRGDDYYVTETRVVNGERRNVRVRKTRWRSVRGRVARDFDDVLVLAADSLPRTYVDELNPWDLAKLVPFRPQYLAGYIAEAYTVDLEPGFAYARQKMDAVIATDIRRDIGGDHQQITQADTRHSGVTFKHILLPIWLAAYKFRGKTYRFVVNARSGEVKGERPYSAFKIALAVIAALLAAAAIAYLNEVGASGGYTSGF